ncbi:hypothetical protein GC173_10540 [bacterium]|nr:hypothetical protein [bacterium]
MSTVLDIDVEDQHDDDTFASNSDPDADTNHDPAPEGYEAAYKSAALLLEIADDDIPRYDGYIEDYWQKSSLCEAIELKQDLFVACSISLTGNHVEVANTYVGPKFGPAADGEHLVGGDDEDHASKPRRRGPCGGFSQASHKNLCDRVEMRLPHHGFLVGRLIHITASPDMSRSVSRIQEQRDEFKELLDDLAEKFGIYFISRIGFSPRSGNTKPHFHAFAVLSLDKNLEACAILSNVLRIEFDREWRAINGHGIQKEGWKLKTDLDAVENAIRYFTEHETHDEAKGHYKRPWHEHGTPPEVPTDTWTVTPGQMRKIWSAICTYYGKREHQFACSFRLADVDPRLLLMLLKRVGVRVTDDQLERYRYGP